MQKTCVLDLVLTGRVLFLITSSNDSFKGSFVLGEGLASSNVAATSVADSMIIGVMKRGKCPDKKKHE